MGFLLQNNAGKGKGKRVGVQLAGQPGGGKGVEGEGEGGCVCHRWLLQGLRWNKDDNRAVDSKKGVGKMRERNKTLKNKRGLQDLAIVVRQLRQIG